MDTYKPEIATLNQKIPIWEILQTLQHIDETLADINKTLKEINSKQK